MATRKPLVQIDGQLQELPAGDTLAGASSSSSVANLNFIGILQNVSGYSRWVPYKSVTVSSVFLTISVLSLVDTVVTLKKNGISVGTITLTAGSYSSPATALSVALTTSDYLTCDLTANGGENLTVNVIYQ